MQTFTGWEYLLIDAANNFGLDKLTFDDRIKWAESNLDSLEAMATTKPPWKELPLYLKAVMAIRKAQAGEATGHLVGFDAICSGMQIMSVLTGCYSGAKATGLVDTNRRADAYTDCTTIMSRMLGSKVNVERKKVKNAVMTALYGSQEEPKKEFGDETPEHEAFWAALYELAPGPCELLADLIGSWTPYAKVHAWTLPDGYRAVCRVKKRYEKRIEVDELDHHKFTYVYYENEGLKTGVKNAANVVHSVDAWILRSLVRRCNYDRERVEWLEELMVQELLERSIHDPDIVYGRAAEETQYYLKHYLSSSVVDPVILPYLDKSQLHFLPTEYIKQLHTIVNSMLLHHPFEIVTIHDDFKCHPNNMNYLRKHYRDILTELARSTLVDDLLTQLYGFPGSFTKKTADLAVHIKGSNYALS